MNQALRNASETDRARALAWMAENCFGDPTDSDGGASARIEGGCEACADALAALLGEVRDEDRGASTPSSSSPSSGPAPVDMREVRALVSQLTNFLAEGDEECPFCDEHTDEHGTVLDEDDKEHPCPLGALEDLVYGAAQFTRDAKEKKT